MANKMTDRYLDNNKQYASGQAVHTPSYPGKQPINPAKHVAVVACMDARIDVEDLLETGASASNLNICEVKPSSRKRGPRLARIGITTTAHSAGPSLVPTQCPTFFTKAFRLPMSTTGSAQSVSPTSKMSCS